MWSFFCLKGRKMELINATEKARRCFALVESRSEEESESLRGYFDRFGLQFHSARDLYVKEGVLVWSSAYTLDQFKLIVKNLVKVFNPNLIAFGNKEGDGYEVKIFEGKNNTYLLKEGKIVKESEITAKLGEKQRRLCLEGSECLMGAYKRESIVKELRSEYEKH